MSSENDCNCHVCKLTEIVQKPIFYISAVFLVGSAMFAFGLGELIQYNRDDPPTMQPISSETYNQIVRTNGQESADVYIRQRKAQEEMELTSWREARPPAHSHMIQQPIAACLMGAGIAAWLVTICLLIRLAGP